MSDSELYPLNHNLIKNVEDTVVSLNSNVFISVSFFIVSYKQVMRKSFVENQQMKKTKKTLISYLYLIRQHKAFKGTIVNRANCHLCMDSHLKLRLQSLQDLITDKYSIISIP